MASDRSRRGTWHAARTEVVTAALLDLRYAAFHFLLYALPFAVKEMHASARFVIPMAA
jgi:hypothetical protein